jgi:anti-anti-sigma factor
LFRRNAVPRDNGPRTAKLLTIHSERDGLAHVVALTGTLDIRSVAAFEREMTRVEDTDALEIVIDLSGLASIDSFGRKSVINATVRSRERGGRLSLIAGCDDVQATFETMGLVTRLPFKRGCRQASQAAAGSARDLRS